MNLKELGFTKHLGNLGERSEKLHASLKSILEPWGIKIPGAAEPVVPKMVEKATSGSGYGKGLGTGLAAGIVGSMGVNAITNSKKKNSPYYPY